MLENHLSRALSMALTEPDVPGAGTRNEVFRAHFLGAQVKALTVFLLSLAVALNQIS